MTMIYGGQDGKSSASRSIEDEKVLQRNLIGSGRFLHNSSAKPVINEDSGIHDCSETTFGSPPVQEYTIADDEEVDAKLGGVNIRSQGGLFEFSESSLWRQPGSIWSCSPKEASPPTKLRTSTPTEAHCMYLSPSQEDVMDKLGQDFSHQLSTGYQPKRLHVSNIPFRYREHNLIMLFGQYGNVEDAEIIYNDKGSKGFGFITMARAKDADVARLKLHNTIVEGRIIEVNLATPKHNVTKSIANPFNRTSVMSQQQGSTIVWRKPFNELLHHPNYLTPSSPKTLVEAEARLAEAQMCVLQMRQRVMYQQMFQPSARTDLGSGQYQFGNVYKM